MTTWGLHQYIQTQIHLLATIFDYLSQNFRFKNTPLRFVAPYSRSVEHFRLAVYSLPRSPALYGNILYESARMLNTVRGACCFFSRLACRTEDGECTTWVTSLASLSVRRLLAMAWCRKKNQNRPS